MRIVVLGAGIIGAATAHALLDEGHEVEIVDGEGPAAGTSQGNAGWIEHLDVMPLASPKVWRYLPRWLSDPEGPLAIAPAHMPNMAPWLWRFLLASRPSRLDASTQAIRAINAEALPAWERRLAAIGLEGMLRRKGFLSVWLDERDWKASQKMLELQRGFGIEFETMDGDAARKLEPAFGPAIMAAALYPTGANVNDPRIFTKAVAQKALDRGAKLTIATIERLEPREAGIALRAYDGREILADRVAICGGIWSKPLAASIGDRVQLDTERGYNLTLEPGRLGLSRPIYYEGLAFVTTPLDTGDRIGGSVEFAGLKAPPNWKRVDAIIGRVKRALPDFDPKPGEGRRWMGFRPSTPDSLPIIGASPKEPRVIHAYGHGHYGLTQAATTAETVAAILAGRKAAYDLTPYDPGRF